MNIKKLLAIISSITITCSGTVGYFPNFKSNKHVITAVAENISPSSIESLYLDSTVLKASDEEIKTSADGWEYYDDGIGITINGYSGTATELVIPDEINGKKVIAIADEAFSDNKRITSIRLGNISRLGYKFLNGCEGITEITIPKTVTEAWYALEGSSIETVVFEEGITKIPSCVCGGASSVKNVILPEKEDVLDGYVIEDRAFADTSISSIKIPESVTQINDYAFSGCTLLTEVVIPDNVTAIGEGCFSGCKRLKTLSFGKSVQSLGYKFLQGCVGITEITIPKTVTEAWYALEGSSIETLSFDQGINTTPECFAADCTTLKTVYLPSSVSEIGDYSFAGCKNLEKIKSSRTLFNFSAHSFVGCEMLDDARFSILDPKNTYLIANSEETGLNGIVNYTLKYKLMPSVAKSANNIEIHLNVPEGLTLLLDTVQSKNLDFDAQSIDNGVISVNSTEGELHFSVRVTEIGDYQVYSTLNFDYNDSWWEQTIGRLNVDCPDITCYSLEKTNSYEIAVHGLADKGKEVTIFVDDKQIDKMISNSYTGKYSTSITLPKKNSGESYSIYAKCNNTSSEKINVVYEENQPAIKSITLIYNGDTRADITKMFTEGVSPVFSLTSTYYQFEIEADHNDQISKIFVTSKKGNITKYLEAKWDANKQLWVTDGYFDPNNKSYIMGALNIKIVKADEIKIDIDNPNDVIDISQSIKDNSKISIIEDNETETVYSLEVSDGENKIDLNVYSGISDEIYIDNHRVTAKEIADKPMDYGFDNNHYVVEENGTEYEYYTKLTGVRKESNGQFSTNCYIKPQYKNYNEGIVVLKVPKSADKKEAAELFQVSYDSAQLLSDIYEKDLPSYVSNLMLGFDYVYNTKEYINRMNKNDSLEYSYKATVLYILKMSNSLATTMLLAPIVGPVAAALLSFSIDKLLDDYGEYLDDYYQNNAYPRSILDPSGYVFEAVTGNPIEDAIVTVYFKDAETGEKVKWNAEDYDQLNPLLTDKEGKYLWDVPEGEWKVICEKEGYETIETDWMSIPPIRTDVNLSLISKDTPVIENVEHNTDSITIKFSKFIDITSVTPESIVLDGFYGTYTIAPQLLSEEDKYADTFILSGDFKNNVTTLSITSNVLSYAGTPAEEVIITIEGTTTTSETTTETTTTTVTETTTTTSNTTNNVDTTSTTSSVTTTQDVTVTVSPYEMSNWAENDYFKKTGIEPYTSTYTEKDDGTLTITLFDEDGKVLDKYVVHSKTGIGFNQNGEQVDLPQTGNNSLRHIFIASISVFLILLGLFAISKSGIIRRKRDDE